MEYSFILEKLGSFGTAIGLLLFIIHQMPKLSDSFGYIASRKLRVMEELVTSDNIDDAQKNLTRNSIAIENFRIQKGIRVNSIYARDALIKLEEESKGEINFRVIQKANSFLEFNNNELHVNLHKYSKLFKGFFSISYWILLSLVIVYVVVFIINPINGSLFEITTWLKMFSLLFMILALTASSFIFLNVVIEIESAEKIKKYIEQKEIKVTSDGVIPI